MSLLGWNRGGRSWRDAEQEQEEKVRSGTLGLVGSKEAAPPCTP